VTQELSIEVLDPEAAHAVAESERVARGDFIRRCATAGALATGGVLISGLPRLAVASAPSAEMDVEIFNFLLMLEYLQEKLYDQALAEGALTGELERFAETARHNEREHISYLRQMLGNEARDPPTVAFGAATRVPKGFQAAALVVEETATAAYIGQGANITKANVLSAARICSVEARHAAWIRDILGRLPAPHAADAARSEAQVMRALRSEGWLK
jgi:hypothetical protein